MDENLAAKRTKRGGIKGVVGTVAVCPSIDRGIERGLAKEVQGHFSFGEKEIPQ